LKRLIGRKNRKKNESRGRKRRMSGGKIISKKASEGYGTDQMFPACLTQRSPIPNNSTLCQYLWKRVS